LNAIDIINNLLENMSSNNQQQTTMMQRSNRDVHWTMAAVGTTVALVALVSEYKSNGAMLSEQSKDYKWATAAISISFALSWCAVFANIFTRTLFVGTVLEGLMVRFLFPSQCKM
jgi:hypothetical protein